MNTITPPARSAIRFSATFLALVGALSGAVLADELIFHGAAELWLTRNTATAVGSMLQLAHSDVATNGNDVRYGDATFQIIPECTGIEVIGLFIAAVCAFPSGWRHKLVGLALGLPILIALNLIRVVLLILAGSRWPDLFEYGHLYVAPLVVLTATVGLWMYWATRVEHAARP